MNTFNGNKENIFFPSSKKSRYHISEKYNYLQSSFDLQNYNTVCYDSNTAVYCITLQKYKVKAFIKYTYIQIK